MILKDYIWKQAEEWLRTKAKVCEYCGVELIFGSEAQYWNKPSIDHRIPLCRGGSTRQKNWALSCRDCNHKKGSLTDEEFHLVRSFRDAGCNPHPYNKEKTKRGYQPGLRKLHRRIEHDRPV